MSVRGQFTPPAACGLCAAEGRRVRDCMYCLYFRVARERGELLGGSGEGHRRPPGRPVRAPLQHEIIRALQASPVGLTCQEIAGRIGFGVSEVEGARRKLRGQLVLAGIRYAAGGHRARIWQLRRAA